MRISDWSSDVCSSDLQLGGDGANASTVKVYDSGVINLGSSGARLQANTAGAAILAHSTGGQGGDNNGNAGTGGTVLVSHPGQTASYWQGYADAKIFGIDAMSLRSEEHTSELQSLMRISYAVFCLTKKKITHTPQIYVTRKDD